MTDRRVSFESVRYPGFRFQVYEEDCEDDYTYLRLVNDTPTRENDATWGLLRMVPYAPAHDANVVTLESEDFPGFYFDAYEWAQYMTCNRIRLVESSLHELDEEEDGPWGLFKIQELPEADHVRIESLKYRGFFIQVHGEGPTVKQVWLRHNSDLRDDRSTTVFRTKKVLTPS